MSERQGLHQEPRVSGSMRRRGLMVAAATLLAGGLARFFGTERAQAANGDNWVIGNTGTGTGAQSASATTQLNGSGGGTEGALKLTNSSGRALYGVGSTGYDGVVGESPNAYGVRGDSTSNAGVYGQSASGPGVRGQSTSNFGAYGTSSTSYGVLGTSTSSNGVHGSTSSGNGVYGFASDNVGVRGESSNNIGVFGYTTGTNASPAVEGVSTAGIAAVGISTNNAGVKGVSTNYLGMWASSVNSHALYAKNDSGAAGIYAAFLDGPVLISGSLTVLGLPKSAAVPGPDGKLRRLYCTESPESYFEDFGSGTLSGGQATVSLEPVFASIVQTNSYLVYLTPEGDCKGLYVAGKTANGFTVRELQGGTSNVGFSYRVVARPKAASGGRLDVVTPPERPQQPSVPLPPGTLGPVTDALAPGSTQAPSVPTVAPTSAPTTVQAAPTPTTGAATPTPTTAAATPTATPAATPPPTATRTPTPQI